MFRTHNIKIAAVFLLFLGGMYFVLAQSSNPGPGTGGGGTNGGGPGSLPANSAQFHTNGTFTFLSGASITNPAIYGVINVVNAGQVGVLELSDSDASHGFKFRAPGTLSSNSVWTLPTFSANGILTVSTLDDSNATLVIIPTASVADATNHNVEAANTHVLSNQLIFIPTQFYNGSNEVSAVAVTNLLDFKTSAFKSITNLVGTNMTWIVTNLQVGASAFMTFRGLPGKTNRMAFIGDAGGTNIIWMNWGTNGTHDIDVRPNADYFVNLFVSSPSNIVATVATSDHLQPAKWATLLTPAGYTRTNAIVGGMVYRSATATTNLNRTITTFSNLVTWPVTGHTLTNNLDELRFISRGKLLSGSNSFVVLFGRTNLLETGTITNGATDYEITGSITRTGNTSQQTWVKFQWGPGNGVYWPWTNQFFVDVGETNGHFQTDLSILGASMRDFGISNLYFEVSFHPGPRL